MVGTAAAHTISPERLAAYADAIVGTCVDLRAGERLLVDCEPGHRELAVALAAAAYGRGASVVDVHYIDRRVQRERILRGGDGATGAVPPWMQARMRAATDPETAIVRIVGDDEPDVLADVDPERAANDFQERARSVRWFSRAVLTDRVRWSIAAWPTAAWAVQVYPGLPAEDAVAALADDLLSFCRLGPQDPPDAWRRHAEMLRDRAAVLTARRFRGLEFRGPGTALDVALADDGRWMGGGGWSADGRETYPNFPTEEVFTSPVAGGTSGTFRCTTPLSFNGRVIDGIAGEFRRGRLVAVAAGRADDQAVLERAFSTDPGAARLGEVALVDGASRIGRAGRIYGETLLDENAASHIALGNGFGETREAGGRINRSAIHVDIMIGSPEVAVSGVDTDGTRVPILADGTWLLS